MSVTPFIWQSRVRFGDTDASGRIFYISLLHHFDAAEAEFLRSLGVGYNMIQAGDIGFPRVHVEADYTGAITYDDLLDIAVKVDRLGRASFTLAFDATIEGRSVGRGKVTIAALDRQTQRATALPERLRAALSS
jgi:acyl-CoA thioester hydrolase